VSALHSDVGRGILGIIAGGIMQGTFAIGMKYARQWAWEHIWLVYSIVGLLLLPALIAALTVPHLWSVYQAVPAQVLVTTALFGLGWGCANVLCGLAFPRVGIALSFAIVIGLSASLGSLVPLVFQAPAKLSPASGWCVAGGVALALLGIGLLGWVRRRYELGQSQGNRGGLRDIKIGLILCILAGILAPMLNFSFAFGSRISAEAYAQGASRESAINAIWLIALLGGFLSNAGYCAVLLARNKSISRYFASRARSHWILAALMGTLWTLGLFCYGWGANLLGEMKAIVGWPMFQSITIVASTGVGIASGEWKGTPQWFVRNSCLGLLLLVGAIVLISVGNNL